jgi:transcriptional regulator with XRE-family HTH domain
MDKQAQASFYAAVGKILQREREKHNLTIYGLSRACGQQINTLRRLEEGKAGMIHHAIWIREHLGVTLDNLIKEAQAISRRDKVKEVKSERPISGDDFI